MKVTITGCTVSGTDSAAAEQVWRCTNDECRAVAVRMTGRPPPLFDLSGGARVSCGKCGSPIALEEPEPPKRKPYVAPAITNSAPFEELKLNCGFGPECTGQVGTS